MGPNDVDEVELADGELSEEDLASVAGGLAQIHVDSDGDGQLEQSSIQEQSVS